MMTYLIFYAKSSHVEQNNLKNYMKLTKLAQLAAVGITVATGLMPLDAEARGRKDRQAKTELAADYVSETDYSAYTTEDIAGTIVELEAEYAEIKEELSALREEGKDLRLTMRTIKSDIKSTEDLVLKEGLESELAGLEAYKEEFKEEKSALREERRALKREMRYLESLISEEAVAEEETTEQL